MGIQAHLDDQALNMLPNVQLFIKNNSQLDRDSLNFIVMREILLSNISLIEMSGSQKKEFETSVINILNIKKLEDLTL